MAYSEAKTFMVENADIIFRNFEGREGPMNTKGQRNFCVFLDPEVALEMIEDDWNVKYLTAREEGEEDRPYIQVSVGYKTRPPRIVLISSTGRTHLTEENVEILDVVDTSMVDLIARGYDWTVNGKSGTKAYVQSMFVTLEEDALERKYAVIEEADDGE